MNVCDIDCLVVEFDMRIIYSKPGVHLIDVDLSFVVDPNYDFMLIAFKLWWIVLL